MALGRALFLAGIFLMMTGDWPRSTLLPTRWVVPWEFLAWPWLYLTLLGTSFVVLAWGGVARVRRETAADFLHGPLALLTGAFLLSVALSPLPWLSEWAFGCLLAVVGFALAVARIAEDETCLAGIPIVIAAAAFFLAARVILWRFDEGLANPAFHVRNNAWLGKIQLSWVLNLFAPILLARCLAERGRLTAILYGATWVLSGAAIYLLFSKTGIVTFPLTALSLCALNARYWRRWLPTLAGITGLAIALIAANPTMAKSLVEVFRRPEETGVVERQGVYRQTLRMVVDHPVVGIGFGTYDDIAHSRYGPIPDIHFFRNGWHAHNTALHILAETGAVGFLAWGYLWFAIARFLLRRWRAEDGPGRLHVSALLGVLLAFLVLSMTEAVTAARLHASLRMNLTLALLVMYGLRHAAAPTTAAR